MTKLLEHRPDWTYPTPLGDGHAGLDVFAHENTGQRVAVVTDHPKHQGDPLGTLARSSAGILRALATQLGADVVVIEHVGDSWWHVQYDGDPHHSPTHTRIDQALVDFLTGGLLGGGCAR